MANDQIELAELYPFLTRRELVAFKNYSALGQSPISPATAEGFYTLFEMGRSCLEIVRLNKGFSLGQVVQCRIDNKWDQRLKEETEQLATNTLNIVNKVKLESLQYQADLIKVHHKMNNDKIAKFLQTGDIAELAGVPLPAYRSLISQLNEITTQKDAQIKIEIKNTVTEKVVDGKVVTVEPADVFKRLTDKLKADE